jgi:hypothetical protein
MLEVFSQPGKPGGILYRMQSVGWPPPVNVFEYEYDPATKKLRRVSGPALTPQQIDAEKLVLGAAAVALLATGVYVGAQVASGVAAWIAEFLAALAAAAA